MLRLVWAKQKVIEVKMSMQIGEIFFTWNECKDEVNLKGHLVKHQHWRMQFHVVCWDSLTQSHCNWNSQVNCWKKFTCKECEDEVNRKGYLVKYQYSDVQFLGLCRDSCGKLKRQFQLQYPFHVNCWKNSTCKECEDKANLKEYRVSPWSC